MKYIKNYFLFSIFIILFKLYNLNMESDGEKNYKELKDKYEKLQEELKILKERQNNQNHPNDPREQHPQNQQNQNQDFEMQMNRALQKKIINDFMGVQDNNEFENILKQQLHDNPNLCNNKLFQKILRLLQFKMEKLLRKIYLKLN